MSSIVDTKMSKSPILTLDPPSELRFKGPFTQVVTADLLLKNLSSGKRVCFKVKTTAPKQYCVRPNGGFVESGQSVKVQVILQPFNYDPTERNRHKFLVQSIICPDGMSTENQEQLWKEATPEQLYDSKLRCVFEMPQETIVQSKVVGSSNSQLPSSAKSTHQEDSCTREHDGGQKVVQDYSNAGRLKEQTQPRLEVSGGRKLPEINIIFAIIIAIIAILMGIVLGKFVL